MEGKIEEWGVGKRHQYLNELTRNQASALFKARTRMIRAKNNERGAHQNEDQLRCRFCNEEETETQQHIFEQCPAIHKDETTKITKEEIFAEYDHTNTKVTANKIINIIKLLEEKGEERKERKAYTGQKYPCVVCLKPCRENQNSVECDECKKWTHLKCTELNHEQFSELSKRPEKEWNCQKCKIIKQTQNGSLKLNLKRDQRKQWTCQPTRPGLTIIIRKDENDQLRSHHKTTERPRRSDQAPEQDRRRQRDEQSEPSSKPGGHSTDQDEEWTVQDPGMPNDSALQCCETNDVCGESY